MQYTIQSGDTLSRIALKFYGDSSRYQAIVAANPQITNPDLIRSGDTIEIPNTSSIPASNQNDVSDQPISPTSSAVTKYIPYALAALAVGFLMTNLVSAQRKKVVG